MGIPAFLLRKLYRRGSLRTVDEGAFAFTIQNPLSDATLLEPPHIVVNGVHIPPADIKAEGVDLAKIEVNNGWVFKRSSQLELVCPGHLLRGGNRIHLTVLTEEFGEVDFLVEDRKAPSVADAGFREEE